MGRAAPFFGDHGDAQCGQALRQDLVAGVVRIGDRRTVALAFHLQFGVGQAGQFCRGGPDHAQGMVQGGLQVEGRVGQRGFSHGANLIRGSSLRYRGAVNMSWAGLVLSLSAGVPSG